MLDTVMMMILKALVNSRGVILVLQII